MISPEGYTAITLFPHLLKIRPCSTPFFRTRVSWSSAFHSYVELSAPSTFWVRLPFGSMAASGVDAPSKDMGQDEARAVPAALTSTPDYPSGGSAAVCLG